MEWKRGCRPVAFWQGTGLLLLGGILSRLLGLYRLLLPRLLGPEGVGLYHMAYPAYALTLAIATGGLPVAVSRLVAQSVARGRHQEALRVLRVAQNVLLALGLIGATGLYLAAPWLALHVARDARAAPAIAAVAPAVLLVAAMSALRGYFQGYQEMAPTAVSQVLEQLVRVVAIVVLASLLRPLGIAWAAAGVAGAAGIGALAGLLSLLVLRRVRRLPRGGARGMPARQILTTLLGIALPITVTGLGVPLMQLLDLAVVPAVLQQMGVAAGSRTGAYGVLSGYAMPLVALPAILSGAIAVALVPAVAAATSSRDGVQARALTRDALAAAWRWLLPAAGGLLLLARPIVVLFFGSPDAAQSLMALAPSALLFGFGQVAASALQGYGYTWRPLANLCVATLVKLGLSLVFVRQMGIVGAALATSTAYAVWAALNLAAIARLTRQPALGAWALPPILAAAGMGIVLKLMGPPTSGSATLLAVAAGGATYLALLGIQGGFGQAEREALRSIARRARSMLEGRR